MRATMTSQRPDLSQTSPEIIAYIQALEAENARWRQAAAEPSTADATAADIQYPEEPPTALNVITVSVNGLIKRTPRHLYSRQRRGGMGIFDLETPSEDAPATLLIADESQTLIVITNHGRALRVPVSTWPASPLRSRGQSLAAQLALEPGEQPALVVADQAKGYLALATTQGYVRLWPFYIVGEKLRSDIPLYTAENFGPPAAACWTSGHSDLFIATRQGLAVRFAEKQVSGSGTTGLRVESGDGVTALAAVLPTQSVFLLGADGRGTIRTMAGFSANKAPGAGGKLALKTDHLVGAVALPEAAPADLFIISRQSKIIRFRADEVPPKEGVVQGVNCMTLRADQTAAICSAVVDAGAPVGASGPDSPT
jgi:DNA gyrase subunit A